MNFAATSHDCNAEKKQLILHVVFDDNYLINIFKIDNLLN